jgi:hypothetical protein
MRQGQGEYAQENGRGAGEIKLARRLFALEQAECDATANPADRRPDFHARKVLLCIEEMMQ